MTEVFQPNIDAEFNFSIFMMRSKPAFHHVLAAYLQCAKIAFECATGLCHAMPNIKLPCLICGQLTGGASHTGAGTCLATATALRVRSAEDLALVVGLYRRKKSLFTYRCDVCHKDFHGLHSHRASGSCCVDRDWVGQCNLCHGVIRQGETHANCVIAPDVRALWGVSRSTSHPTKCSTKCSTEHPTHPTEQFDRLIELQRNAQDLFRHDLVDACRALQVPGAIRISIATC